MKAYIRYGLGGGFGGVGDWEEVEVGSEAEAATAAWEAACEDYESYVGMYGIRDTGQIMEEDGVDEGEAWEVFSEEREGWIEYAHSMSKPADFV